MDDVTYWDLIRAERTRLAEALADVGPGQWRTQSLCVEWSVEDVVAHLSAAANTGRWVWIRNMVVSGFNSAKHNERLLRRYLGDTHAETLAIFRRSVDLRIAPTKDYAAFLGEVIVHSQDIAGPLGLAIDPDPIGLKAVAEFFATKDFAVRSRTLVHGLSLEASDAQFAIGQGPQVTGRLLDMVMAMAGRQQYADDLSGDGAEELLRRMS